jgi:hypothetical protein
MSKVGKVAFGKDPNTIKTRRAKLCFFSCFFSIQKRAGSSTYTQALEESPYHNTQAQVTQNVDADHKGFEGPHVPNQTVTTATQKD